MRYGLLWRILADICLVVGIAWAPWWAAAVVALAFAWLFAPYYELIAAGIAYDSLYGVGSSRAAMTALIIFIVVELVKKRTRVNLS